MAAINPATVASLDKNNLALVSRLQWPNDPLGSLNTAFSINRFSPRINSSFGISGSFEKNLAGSYIGMNAGLQYGYRVLFLEAGYLCFGMSAVYSDAEYNIDDFSTFFDPKANDLPVLPDNRRASDIKGNVGILFHDPQTRYIGFSMRDILVYRVSNDTGGTFERGYTFSFQARGHWPVSREASVLPYFMYEHYGQLAFNHNDGAEQVIIKPYSMYFLQLNLYKNKAFVIGMGYKFYPRNFGSTNYRIAFFPGGQRTMVGYSFDTKPFIQNDKIHWISSHEVSLKYLISTNN